MNLLIGITIGMMIGFVIGMFLSGHAASDPISGLPRIEVFSTTMTGCIITIVIVLLYLYLAEWSTHGKVREEKAKTEEV
nr:hypothetical protein [Candidatus Sigynarchaeota archaeon]